MMKRKQNGDAREVLEERQTGKNKARKKTCYRGAARYKNKEDKTGRMIRSGKDRRRERGDAVLMKRRRGTNEPR